MEGLDGLANALTTRDSFEVCNLHNTLDGNNGPFAKFQVTQFPESAWPLRSSYCQPNLLSRLTIVWANGVYYEWRKDLGLTNKWNGAWLLDSKNQEGEWRLNMLGLLLGFIILLFSIGYM